MRKINPNMVNGLPDVMGIVDEYKTKFDNLDIVNVKDFGAVGDGITDDTQAIQAAIDNGGRIYFPSGIYYVTEQLLITKSTNIIMNNEAVINFDTQLATNPTCFMFQGSFDTSINLSSDVNKGDSTITVTDSTTLNIGDWVYLESDEVVSSHARSYDTKREFLQIKEINGNIITFETNILFDHLVTNNARISKCNFLENCSIEGGTINSLNLRSTSYGIKFYLCMNFTIENCKVVGFDYSCIESDTSIFGLINNNYVNTDYSKTLQYGITIHSSFYINVSNNKGSSSRTSIDVTRLSQFVNIEGNTSFKGAINTHTAFNINIIGNTINGGGILIRGSNINIISNHVVNEETTGVGCLDLQEAGIEGKTLIKDNQFRGLFSLRLFTSNTLFIDNIVYCTRYNTYPYYDKTRSSIIRISSASIKEGGLTIKGNRLEYIGDTPPIWGIDGGRDTDIIENLEIIQNTIKGCLRGINVSQVGATPGNNCEVSFNTLEVIEQGIEFRLVNNTKIIGNTIVGIDGGTTHAIEKAYVSDIDQYGLIIAGNIIKNCSIGISASQGSGKVYNALITSNIFINVTTNYDMDLIVEEFNSLYVVSPGGTRYKITVDDTGVLSTTTSY